MSRRRSLFNRNFLGACLCTFVLLAGCITDSVNPQKMETCISPTHEANPYSFESADGVVGIYSEYRNHYFDNDPFLRNTIMQKAFMLLGKYTERWSYYVDIPANDTQLVRITVTYIHPVLIHHIVLNNTISNSINMETEEFRRQVQDVVGKLTSRNELLFGITISTSTYNQQASNINNLTIRLPIWAMVLVNSSGLEITPVHVDPVLRENITIAREPVFGLVGYPTSVLYHKTCTWIMDPLNTTLVLEIPSVSVGAVQYPTQYWSIPYRSSILSDVALPVLSVNTPTHTYDSNFDMLRISRTPMPPYPNRQSNDGPDNTNWKLYWEDMGRYLWFVLIPGNFP